MLVNSGLGYSLLRATTLKFNSNRRSITEKNNISQYIHFIHNDSNLLIFSDLTRGCEGAIVDDIETLDRTEKYNFETIVQHVADGANLL